MTPSNEYVNSQRSIFLVYAPLGCVLVALQAVALLGDSGKLENDINVKELLAFRCLLITGNDGVVSPADPI
jgi:hypothetical protein